MNILKKEKYENNQGEQVVIKRGLPLFMLTFENQESVDKIYGIKTILNMAVKIEPLRRNTRFIPQYKRCQNFNHTQTYCRKEPRCFKCAGKHFTRNCSISRQTTPKCINCKGSHPQTIEDTVAKEFQMRRDKIMKSQKQKIQQPTKAKVSSKKIVEGLDGKPITPGPKTYA